MTIPSTGFSIIFFLFLLFAHAPVSAQTGQWQWIKGSAHHNATPHYGIKGIPDPLNEPGGLYEAVEWTDLNGNFWIYGGLRNSNVYNDLWKYDPLSNEWTWMSGTAVINDMGNYGVKGVPSPGNRPPCMGYGAAAWTDLAGDLWMFGGYNLSIRCDLWKYHIATNEWTWMKGSGIYNDTGIAGIRTVPDTGNYPGSRAECNAAWRDNNNLWLFGGQLFNTGEGNDLWRYEIGTNTWTWMKGSITGRQPGSQTAIGIEDSSNYPSGRLIYNHWNDSNGNLWMFGGFGYDGSSMRYLGDMWKYNITSNNWTYMGGENLTAVYVDNYGSKCQLDAVNWPKPRTENRAFWTDKNGDFWMYGGVSQSGNLSDLWKYCVSTNQWVWVGGSQTANDSASGQPGIYSPTNTAGARFGAVGFRYNDTLYVYGGVGVGNELCDLWKFVIDDSCGSCLSQQVSPVSHFTFTDSTFCEGVCVNFSNQSVNATSYQWFFPGGSPSYDTLANPQNICYNIPGSYDVTLIATNSNGTDTMLISNAITYTQPITFSPIQQHGDTLISVSGYYSYQWYINGNVINGATNYWVAATQNGDYSVQVTDTNGCSATAFILNVVTDVRHINVVTDFMVLQMESGIQIIADVTISIHTDISITDVPGQQIFQKSFVFNQGRNEVVIPFSLAAGVYFVTLRWQERVITKKIVVGG
jgi:PKD repeat protein